MLYLLTAIAFFFIGSEAQRCYNDKFNVDLEYDDTYEDEEYKEWKQEQEDKIIPIGRIAKDNTFNN